MDFNKQFDTLDFSDDQPQTTPCFHNWSTFDVKSLISVATCGYFVPKFRHSFFQLLHFLQEYFVEATEFVHLSETQFGEINPVRF